MQPENQLVSRETPSSIAVYSPEQLDVITNHIAKGATPVELQYFLSVSKRLGLDPFGRQIYFVKRYDSKQAKEVGTVQVSIDGFRAIGARTGLHAGTDDIEYDTEEGDHPNKAMCTVYRLVGGKPTAFKATARWIEYVQTNKGGDPQFMWKKMPWLMLGKVAESLALRRAFPEFLSGVYTHEEMSQADTEDRGLDSNNATTVTVETIDPLKAKAKQDTLFYLQMLFESSKADPAEVRSFLETSLGVSSLGELTEGQALKLTSLMEQKMEGRIEKIVEEDKPQDPEPPITPPEAPTQVETPKNDPIPQPEPKTYLEPTYEPVPEPPARRDWIKEASNVQFFDDGMRLISEMELAGESTVKTRTVMGMIKNRFPDPKLKG